MPHILTSAERFLVGAQAGEAKELSHRVSLLAATYESPSTVDYRKRRAASPLIAAVAEKRSRHTGKVYDEDMG